MADRQGEQLGNYRLTRLLGRGGFADVYLGEHVYLKTHAAIKILHTQLTEEDLQNFLQEAQTIAHLEHPHIVRILDFGVQGSTPFLVMSYASGGTLRTRHPKGSIVPLATIISYIKQSALALQYAHDQKLIHRDIKPENLLVGRNNDILVSDFGIAAVAHSTTSLKTGAYSGTVPYSAPEQINGKPRPASDQYALGIIVYEWLTGTRPFSGSSHIEIAMHHISDPPAPLRSKVPSISPTVEQVVLRALAKDPQHRFASVQAFATALEQASVGREPLRSPVVEAQVPHISPPPPTPVSPPVPAPSITSSWSMFGYDLARTRFNPHERILSPTNVSRLVPLWSAPTGGSINSSPAVANEVLYVGSYDKKLYAFEAGTGKPLWSAPTGGEIYSSPAVANGVVYVGSWDNKLYAFEAGTGKPLWSATTGGRIVSSPAVANGVVYVGSLDHKLYAFEAGTGKPLWNAATGAAIYSSPAVANGVLYVGSEDFKLYAFEAGTGKPLWSAPTDAAISSSLIVSSPAAANGVVYVGSDDTKLYAFEAGTGKPRWSAPTGNNISSSPAVANGVVYVGSWDHKLYAFEAGTGKPLWSATTGKGIRSSSVVANGVVYVGSDDRKLYAFEAGTGKPLWNAPTGGYIRSSPAVANGVVYVGSNDHKLYAFHLP